MNDPYNPQSEKSALDIAENKLYDQKQKIQDPSRHRVVDGRTSELPASWGDDPIIMHHNSTERRFSLGAMILIGSIIILVVSLLFTLWRVASSRNVVSSDRITMTGDVAPTVEGGEPIPFVLSLENLNESSLIDASIVLSYKQGVGSQDEQEKIEEKRVIGTINPRDYKRQDFKIMVYGSEGESRDITAMLNYKVAGSNAVFSKTIVSTVIIKTPSLSVRIDGGESASLGQDATYSIMVKNTTSTTSKSSLLLMTLPTTFSITSSTPKKNDRATSWVIPELTPGETQTVTLIGSMSGTKGEVATMRAVVGSLGSSLSNVDVVYASQTFDITLRASPLSLSYSLETERNGGDTLQYGDRATLAIKYSNGNDVPLRDVSLLLSITGDAADLNGIRVEDNKGYYDSINKTVLWNKTTLDALKVVGAGSEGTVRVYIPIVSRGANSPKLIATVVGTASTDLTDDVQVKIANTWSVQGTASLKAETHYKNTSIPNTGPIPPKPNVDTTYTARISVSAQNTLVGTTVSFALPAYVSWRNSSSDPSAITYNAKTRTVTWAISSIEAGKTVMADISLSVKASQSQINQSPQITSAIILDTQEQISRARVKTTLSPLTTQIFGESYTADAFLVTP